MFTAYDRSTPPSYEPESSTPSIDGFESVSNLGALQPLLYLTPAVTSSLTTTDTEPLASTTR